MEGTDAGGRPGGTDAGGRPGGAGDPTDGPFVPESIQCVDCGGTCHLLTPPYRDEDGGVGFEEGDVVSYRCSDCLDRWDIVVE